MSSSLIQDTDKRGVAMVKLKAETNTLSKSVREEHLVTKKNSTIRVTKFVEQCIKLVSCQDPMKPSC